MAGKLLLLFIALPLIELWLLIKVGSVIGATWTILLILATALIGTHFVRQQGLSVMQKVRKEQMAGRVPAGPMLEGVALLVAGVLLVLPGIITDIFGILLLIPSIRTWATRHILLKTVIIQPHNPHGGHTYEGEAWRKEDHETLEGDYERRDD